MVGGLKFEWAFAVNYGTMEEYDIPKAATNRRPDGTVFITAEKPWKVTR